MSIFPGNILIIDDQFNLGYLENEPNDSSKKIQWENFRRLRHLFDSNGFCYSVITETKDIGDIISKIKRYQNIRLLILDLDLDESGDVEDVDIEMVKHIVLASLNIFGYYFLAINSSFSEKWESIKLELLSELMTDEKKNKRKIHFLSNFCVSLNKTNTEIEEQLLKLLSDKFSNELITQFEASLNSARDKAFSPFMDFASDTWEHVYNMLREDMDSREHINFTLNSLLIGLLKQQLIGINYTIPTSSINKLNLDIELQQNILISFNYLSNINRALDQHPIWTGNLYYTKSADEIDKYTLIITPECDIAQNKSVGYTVVSGFEFNFPENYKPENYIEETPPPLIVRFAGKKTDGKWKPKNEIESFFKGPGFYILPNSSINRKHIIFDLRSVHRISSSLSENSILILRVNEPIITDITDRISYIFNRKGVPRLVQKNYIKF